MMERADAGTVYRAYNEAENARDHDSMSRLLADDIEITVNCLPALSSATDDRRAMAALFTAYPDYRREILGMVEAGGSAAVRWRMSGTPAPPYRHRLGLLDLHGCSIVEVVDGRIRRAWLYFPDGPLVAILELTRERSELDMQIAMRNNALWLIVGTSGAVVIGLLFAVLVDRVKREAFAKTFVFLPLAISAVGASVIWRFVYAWRPPGGDQIGLLNAAWTGAGNEPVAFLQVTPWNNLFLIIIMVWLQTGFAMVVLSAALKGVPTDFVEAARIDGATETQLFFRVVLPSMRGAVITVATTIFIAIRKVFDIVFVMTGGRFETEVIANRMFAEMFKFRNFGRASALAVVLLIVVIPIMAVNIRNLRRQGIGA